MNKQCCSGGPDGPEGSPGMAGPGPHQAGPTGPDRIPTGVELIAQERHEQMTAHGRTIESDSQYAEGTLTDAAMAILIEDDYLSFWPLKWETKLLMYIKSKSKLERLKIAGAFIAAELDQELKRIHYNAWPPRLFNEESRN